MAGKLTTILKVDPHSKVLSSSLLNKMASLDGLLDSEEITKAQRGSLSKRIGTALKIAFPESPEIWRTKPLGPRPQMRFYVGLTFV